MKKIKIGVVAYCVIPDNSMLISERPQDTTTNVYTDTIHTIDSISPTIHPFSKFMKPKNKR